MKKRFLSLLLALCLISALIPAALASGNSGPDTIVGPNGEVYEIPVLENMPQTMATSAVNLSGSGTAADPYLITNEEDFMQLNNTSLGLANKHFKLMDDLDFSSYTVSEWGGLINYFWGTLDGNNKEITGINTNRFLFYGWFGGEIKNLVFNVNGKAPMIAFTPGKLSSNPDVYDSFTLSNVATVSYSVDANGTKTKHPVVLSSDDQSNYSPFLYCAAGKFLMQNCRNYIDLSGNAYAGVFFGYHIMDTTGTYTFSGCENHGDIAYRDTGLFFGNPEVFDSAALAPSTGKIKIYTSGNTAGTDYQPCYNYGKLTGTQSVNLFCSMPYNRALTGNYAAYENDLKNVIHGSKNCANDPYCGKDHAGSMVSPTQITGLDITKNDDNLLVIKQPTDSTVLSSVDHYTISYVAYVQRYDKNFASRGYWNGTARYMVTETVPKATNGNSIVTPVGIYDVCDLPLNNSWEWEEYDIIGDQLVIKSGNTLYYSLDSETEYQPEVTLHASTDLSVHTCSPSQYVVTAYDVSGSIVGTTIKSANEV